MGESIAGGPMLSIFDQTRVYFARDAVDMRKQIDGLALMVQETLELDPFEPALFAFCNRQRDKVKILYWQDNGFCLLYKRMEKGRFQWPKCESDTVICSARQLQWLLDGLSLSDLMTAKKLAFTDI